MDPILKKRTTDILEYLKRCREQKEEKINILMKSLARSKVTEIKQEKLFTLTKGNFFSASGIRAFCNPEMGKRKDDDSD